MFHTEYAGLLSKSAVVALRTYAPPLVGVCRGSHRKAVLLSGAVRALCRNAPKAWAQVRKHSMPKVESPSTAVASRHSYVQGPGERTTKGKVHHRRALR